MGSAGSLDGRQIELLRESFVNVLLDPDRAARHFYEHLFVIAPATEPMFNDMAQQRRVLIQTLAVTVTGLSDVAKLTPTIRALGERHHGYGVRADHYASVGEALIHMVEAMANGSLDAETEQAWRTAYAFISGEMIAAAEEPGA